MKARLSGLSVAKVYGESCVCLNIEVCEWLLLCAVCDRVFFARGHVMVSHGERWHGNRRGKLASMLVGQCEANARK